MPKVVRQVPVETEITETVPVSKLVKGRPKLFLTTRKRKVITFEKRVEDITQEELDAALPIPAEALQCDPAQLTIAATEQELTLSFDPGSRAAIAMERARLVSRSGPVGDAIEQQYDAATADDLFRAAVRIEL